MPNMKGVILPDGREWTIGADVDGDADIIISTDRLEGLTATQIGEYVLSLVRPARLYFMEYEADYILQYDKADMCPSLPPEIVSEMREYQSESERVRTAYERIAAREETESLRAYWKTLPRYADRSMRQEVINRDVGRCRYCGVMIVGTIYLDHVMPFSRGGATGVANLVCSCFKCNSKKYDRLPEECGMALIPID